MTPGGPANEKALEVAFVDCCVQQFLDGLETLSGLRLSRDASAGALLEISDTSDLIGREQSLEQAPDAAFWIALSGSQAAHIGERLVPPNRTGESDPQSALADVLTGALDAAVRQIAATFLLGDAQHVKPHRFENDDAQSLIPIQFSVPEGIPFCLYLGISPQLKTLMSGRIAGQAFALPPGIPGAGAAAGGTLDMLLDFELPVSISFGRKKLAFKDLLKLGPNSVVELNRAPDDLVELIVNDSVIAWGEVIIIDGQYGVRIRRLASGALKPEEVRSVQAV